MLYINDTHVAKMMFTCGVMEVTSHRHNKNDKREIILNATIITMSIFPELIIYDSDDTQCM